MSKDVYTLFVQRTVRGDFVTYLTTVDDSIQLCGGLTPSEYAIAKIIRYVYEKHHGWPKDFHFRNETYDIIASPGRFGNLGGPTEVPQASYVGKKEKDTFEDKLIASIKYRIDMRKELLHKIINEWNIPTSDVIVRHGIDQYEERQLC